MNSPTPEMNSSDKAIRERFEWWHEAVFGQKPIRDAIPHWVMREYEDLKWRLAQATKGVDNGLLAMSIKDIKARGRLVYEATKAVG